MKELNAQIRYSMNYEEMIPMFTKAGLEMDPEEKSPKGLLQCYEVLDPISGRRIGGGSLIHICGVYVIKTIAIEKQYQGMGLGTQLTREILADAQDRGADCVYLNAKVPAFYETLGFRAVAPEEAPDISTCHQCHRFHHGCNAEIMRKDLA